MTEERLREFAAAWVRRDVEALMTFLTDDCVFEASIGPVPGKTSIGREAVRREFEEMLMHNSHREFRGGEMFLCGDKGVGEWSSVWTEPDGRLIEQRGCDIYEFQGDKIRRKSAFRKTWA